MSLHGKIGVTGFNQSELSEEIKSFSFATLLLRSFMTNLMKLIVLSVCVCVSAYLGAIKVGQSAIHTGFSI